MGPYPHDAAPATISADNPAGTDGFAFVEFAHPDSGALADLFRRMGFAEVAHQKSRDIALYRQGRIDFILNRDPDGHSARFAALHGPCASAMAWRVADAQHALHHALACGATEYVGPGKTFDVPAIIGIGGSLLYFLDRADPSPYASAFAWSGPKDLEPPGAGFHYIDHLTHNVRRGNMDLWTRFYEDIFGFREIRYFNISGKMTGLVSRALTSPCGKIRIPINESADNTSQIEEFLHHYRGEGIQHIALGTDDIYGSADALAENGVQFMPSPPDAYYQRSGARVTGHAEPIERMRRHGILIDGIGVVGGVPHILLQVFSRTVIGPIFFEFIQRKGDEGFGEGNFKALFESIEEDQLRRGVLKRT